MLQAVTNKENVTNVTKCNKLLLHDSKQYFKQLDSVVTM